MQLKCKYCKISKQYHRGQTHEAPHTKVRSESSLDQTIPLDVLNTCLIHRWRLQYSYPHPAIAAPRSDSSQSMASGASEALVSVVDIRNAVIGFTQVLTSDLYPDNTAHYALNVPSTCPSLSASAAPATLTS